MTSETQSENLKLAGLLVAGALLEALYLRMHSLYYLKNHAIAFMVLALGAGILGSTVSTSKMVSVPLGS